MVVDRRSFLLTSLAAAAAHAQAKSVRFGVIADLHHGLAPDATARLEAFMAEVARRPGLDFLIQLGDFCHPTDEGKEFVALFDRFAGPHYHVLGNHDMDRGTKADALVTWGAPQAWYSFNIGPFRFIVLDLNHIRQDDAYLDYEQGNYFKADSLNWAGDEQLAWLQDELQQSEAPTIVFSHQPLGNAEPGKLPASQQPIFEVLRHSPTALCLYGHLHVDRLDTHHGITCLGINSASYHWSGGMHPYRDPLFAFVELTAAGRLTIEGRRSEYSTTDPRETTAKKTVGANPWISDRDLVLTRG